jgi:polyferredoxin
MVLARGSPMIRTILLVVIVLALLGSLPLYPYSAGWGYYPSGGFGLIALILILVLLFGNRATV